MSSEKRGVTVPYMLIGVVIGALWGAALATSIILQVVFPRSDWAVGVVLCGVVAFVAFFLLMMGDDLDG